ncbi:hypothetical protein B4102_1341 [Heyndrickxia sporothermodurans]|uniref:YqgU-like 6-bladed beta-propeller domain-containing protein n=3 Tax=Heyndrickxia sporothermodurans TaxID=46224 RepID=A0A150KP36_9BACI|nr:hypothetical protein B4102_1341 [Heyndrickxia sporothermodurans]
MTNTKEEVNAMKKKQKRHTSFFILFFLFLIAFILCGCQQQKSNQSPKQKETNINQIIPLTVNENQFEKIVGWLSNNTVVYIKHQNRKNYVYSYQLETGTSELLFKSNDPIKNVIISPNHKKVLVQTAPSTYLAKLYMVDRKGKLLFSKEVKSFDLSYDWNENNPNILAISVFYEDWTFNVLTLDINNESLTKHNFSDPFIKWFGKNEVLFQKWDKLANETDAPLMSYSMNNPKGTKTLLNNIYQFDTFNHFLMTITLDPENKENAMYHFYNESLIEQYSFLVPHFGQFSDGLVPYHDFIIKENKFITFVPYENGSIDDNEGNFKLMEYDILKKSENVMFDQLPNEPLSCSLNGKVCLYGFQFEKLVDVQNKKIIPLVKLEKKKEQ